MLSLVLLPISSSFAADPSQDAAVPEYTLPPLVVHGSASDLLPYDPIVPPLIHAIEPSSPNGTVGGAIEQQLPLPVSDPGTPGNTTQIRGLGISVQDTNVQTLGIPLNPPGGSGFDLGSFPQFFWSRYELQLGSSTGAFDPRGNVSTLTLNPWTAQALSGGHDSHRVTQLFTDTLASSAVQPVPHSNFLSQTSAAASQGRVAALAGYSAGTARGPTGSLSTRLFQQGHWELQAHLLATSVQEISPGFIGFATPLASLKTTRWIPLAQLSYEPSSQVIFKSSVFFDRNDLSYSNPDPGAIYASFTRSEQWGIENALVVDDWKFGVSARAIGLREEQLGDPTVNIPDEGVFHLLAGRTLRLGTLTLDSILEANNESRTGWRPAFTLGARQNCLGERLAIFARASYAFDFPTLNDRFYSLPGQYVANPGLIPEQASTATVGMTWQDGRLETTLQGIAVLKRNSLLTVTDPSFVSTVINAGHASGLSLLHLIRADITPWLEASNALRLSRSAVESTSEMIPYDPGITEILEAAWHRALGWRAGTSIRAVNRQSTGTPGVSNPGYAYWNLEASLLLSRSGDFSRALTLQASVQNLLDRPIQVIRGFPWPGRLYAIGLTGTL